MKKPLTYGDVANPNNRAAYAKKVIAVTSGKGGVGKSTVSSNLAVALKQEGYKVGLLDADVYGPDIPRMFQVSDERLKWGEGEKENKMLPVINYGVKLMSVGMTLPEDDTPLIWRSSVAISALIQFLEDVDWEELDFLIIDMPPGTGDVQLTMAEELPISAALIVTTPQTVCKDDVNRAVRMYKDLNIKIGGIVENMSYFVAPDTGNVYYLFGKDGAKEIAMRYDVPLLAQIPFVMSIREGADNGEIAVACGDETVKNAYKLMAKNLLDSMGAKL